MVLWGPCVPFLNEVVTLFNSYFTVFTEDSLKNNFVIIYELLDEILDHGFPQITNAALLKSYITQTVRPGIESWHATCNAVTVMDLDDTGAWIEALGEEEAEEEANVREQRGLSRVMIGALPWLSWSLMILGLR